MLTLIVLALVVIGIVVGLSLFINRLAQKSTGGDSSETVYVSDDEEVLTNNDRENNPNSNSNQRTISRNRTSEANSRTQVASVPEIDRILLF